MLPSRSRPSPPVRAVNIPFAWLPHPSHGQIYWDQALTSFSLASHPFPDQMAPCLRGIRAYQHVPVAVRPPGPSSRWFCTLPATGNSSGPPASRRRRMACPATAAGPQVPLHPLTDRLRVSHEIGGHSFQATPLQAGIALGASKLSKDGRGTRKLHSSPVCASC